MQEDVRGFRYPVIDRTNCIHCKHCETVCPHDYKHFIGESTVKAYIGVHQSEDVIYQCSSGGAFTAIYEALIKEGYTVFGARFTDSLQVVHDSATTVAACESFRKSKYIQSDSNHSFAKIKQILSGGGKVLFSGTPCQCAALNSYLALSKVSTEQLCTVSILCHGVPSQRMFQTYQDELNRGSKHGSLVKFEFRYKTKDGSTVNSRSAELVFADGYKKNVQASDDPFMRSYYLRLGYRPSCTTCEFSRHDRVSDITLGDAWKIEKLYPQYNPLFGVSLILSATDQGHRVLSKLKDMPLTEISADWALNSQGVLNHPTAIHKDNDLFFQLLPKLGFRAAVFRVTNGPFLRRALSKVKFIVKRILGLS
jgi:coenzyme F420-reducing hydrogenase beta subunit